MDLEANGGQALSSIGGGLQVGCARVGATARCVGASVWVFGRMGHGEFECGCPCVGGKSHVVPSDQERDRQGPDPRFPNNATPPPLDVYQFIWDRTRMVRKDFILQNYVGTGGKCDARAVRCHERIARWHTMCEHQLSHIPDFVTMQSQQNIQELGQTMKTLNQYYDDSKNRSLVEEADDDGNEMRKDISSLTHGCSASSVQGKAPVDYDGSALANENDPALVSSRLIGKEAAQLPHHGTAEPEMRGLYILLTIDNDGGMEVLKYVASLYQKRPVIYQSRPVQLALSIYKVRGLALLICILVGSLLTVIPAGQA